MVPIYHLYSSSLESSSAWCYEGGGESFANLRVKKWHLVILFCIFWCEAFEQLKTSNIFFLGQPAGVTLHQDTALSSDFCCLYHLPVDLVRSCVRHLNVGPLKAHSTYLADTGYISLFNGYLGPGRLAFPVGTCEQEKPTLPHKHLNDCWIDQSWG